MSDKIWVEDVKLPASLEAERAVLGSILLNDKLFIQVSEVVHAEVFFWDSHRIIFRRMAAMWASGTAIDLVTLTEQLIANGEIEKIGGAVEISNLTNGMPRLDNIEHYVEILKRYNTLRTAAREAEKLGAKAFAQDPVEEIVASAETFLKKIRASGKTEVFQAAQMFKRTHESPDAMFTDWQKLRGLETGFHKFDALTNGLQKGEMTILAARPSVGKTAFALNIAANVSLRQSKNVLVFSLEMSGEALVMRTLCAEAKVDSHAVRSGFSSGTDKRKLSAAYLQLARAPFYIADGFCDTVGAIRASSDRVADQYGLDLVIVDYLQLMSAPRRENRTQEISAVSRGLKEMAKELRIPLIAVSQLNRSSEDHEGTPKLSDLRESGQIEQDADVVAFLSRDAGSKRAKARSELLDEPQEHSPVIGVTLTIEKQRNGPTGKVSLQFHKQQCRFYEEAVESKQGKLEDKSDWNNPEITDADLPENI